MGLFDRKPAGPPPAPPTPLASAEDYLRRARTGGIYNQVIADALCGLLTLEVERAKREGWS